MTDLSEIVDSLLAISPWPWGIAEGNFIVYDFVSNTTNTGRIAAEVPCQGGNLADLNFIASSPVWLAQLVVAIMQEHTENLRQRAWFAWIIKGKIDASPSMILDNSEALRDFNLTEEKFEELKRKLETAKC